MSNPIFQPVKPDVQIPALEEAALGLWDDTQAFEKSQSRPGRPTYSFYDGPPFATGLPHYGHILAGVLKDVVPRYWTMQGYNVPRRFGWDCHGLPVEYEINKAHKLESRKDILALGVDKYNALCRGIVKRYSEEWKKTVRRTGRWVDMDHPYFTMDVEFMQSVWWVFKELYDRGLVYEGYKVVPYSTGISTPLSNFEANLNYKEVQDPALTVAFQIVGSPGEAILAWTTTPWTLPSNMALAVGRDIDYVRVRDKASGQIYWVAEARVESVWKTAPKAEPEYEIVGRAKGAELIGKKYEPLFSYFADRGAQGAFRVIHSDHVAVDSGTGIVHMAPAFGEEDYQACAREKVPLVNPVDDDGMFTVQVPDYAGRRVKEADKDIIAELKKRGRLLRQETIMHSYPFCYRSDTPLIYRAVSSWFVAVEKVKDKIVRANKTTNWVPEHLRDGRFGNWLEGARDWAISRNRFWGTPLPLWRNAEGEMICIGSKDELEQLSGQKVDDLHIDVIDKLTIPSKKGGSPLKRVEGVLDCWFESGSMPYAQWGYPRQNREQFEKGFPAEFIAEGLDQTRGWFYTLMVIGAALFDKAPFKNVVVNGLVLAEDGRKMSKSLRNYPDPMEVLNKHGADALRLYLIDSPVVKAQELRFAEKGVHDVVRRILLRWWNSYSFFVNYANVDGFKPSGKVVRSENWLDAWVLSRLNSLVAQTEREMAAYRLYNVVPALLQFIEDLTNTYIRFNRPHFWKEGMPEDKRQAYETLYEVLLTLSKVMAPFAPFMAETTYQNLVRVGAKREESVHLESFPKADEKLIRRDLEEAVRVMEAVVQLGRNQREKIKVKAKIPLKRLRIIQRNVEVLNTLKKLEPYFAEELNVQAIDYDFNESQWVQISAKANFTILGKRLGSKMKAVAAEIQKLDLPRIQALELGSSITIQGEMLTIADIEVRRTATGNNENVAVHPLVSIELDPTVTQEQVREGLAREVTRKVQAARKAGDFKLDDRIRLELHCDGELLEAVKAHEKFITSETLTKEFSLTGSPGQVKGQHVETAELEEGKVVIGVTPLKK